MDGVTRQLMLCFTHGCHYLDIPPNDDETEEGVGKWLFGLMTGDPAVVKWGEITFRTDRLTSFQFVDKKPPAPAPPNYQKQFLDLMQKMVEIEGDGESWKDDPEC